MIKLYGVVHGCSLITIFDSIEHALRLTPSEEFIEDLKTLPKGSRIGIEYLSQEDWSEIQSYIDELADNEGVNSFYYESSSSYWDNIINNCKKFGHEVVFFRR